MVKRILNVIIMFLIILCMFFIVYDVKADNFNEIAISVIDPTEDMDYICFYMKHI